MNLQTLAIAFMSAVTLGGLAWVFLYPALSGERQAEKRRASLARPENIARRVERNPQRSRREQVEDTLKDVENRAKQAKKVPLNIRLEQAGVNWTKRQFMIGSAVLGIATFLLFYIVDANFLATIAFAGAAGFGLPRWVLNFLKKRREKKFLDALPDAVDVIVRGVKAGLPLFDSLKVVVNDSPEPLRSEFRAIIETQSIGMPLGEACMRLYERMPLPEANFFGIVVGIQMKSGGNLSEALGNLSKVLRDRKKMKAKIQAMSMEAKASAGIIGSLPPAVMMIVYFMSPDYISLLWTEPAGRVMLAVSGAWMFAGVMIMKKMINFDF
ncbi:type II secretion system protein [Afipia carboxidovorans OM5]|uniref:Flp pilus assembly protein TadB n=1 Tax=Afipia carboxidovorans (strain ATCC 49405 / DSM 1227 / KCTC 32145 / OM5) TaxID=504832 RepID=B6JJD2_AFIC5|nr:type II secretion system F family protein [Afipia carboxidovorans]ACI94526.1 type II secretion system protein [Afipia carboxidovorans OM5]AEI01856.1 flp pilus assembly protein TadB [Afipia carboxidovorans OM4]AEI05431.1 flp pilus assembly protein TadB [Afipia carboxidovorans OM5]BEV46191.1 type II secretion system F family protein [Afipia carboxidovorans]